MSVGFALSVFSSAVESHIQQHPPPSTFATMTSTLQATVSGLPAAVSSHTQTSCDSQFAHIHASVNQLLAQTQTSSSLPSAQIPSGSGPQFAQAQGSSGLLLTQAQHALGIQPAQTQVSVFYHGSIF